MPILKYDSPPQIANLLTLCNFPRHYEALIPPARTPPSQTRYPSASHPSTSLPESPFAMLIGQINLILHLLQAFLWLAKLIGISTIKTISDIHQTEDGKRNNKRHNSSYNGRYRR